MPPKAATAAPPFRTLRRVTERGRRDQPSISSSMRRPVVAIDRNRHAERIVADAAPCQDDVAPTLRTRSRAISLTCVGSVVQVSHGADRRRHVPASTRRQPARHEPGAEPCSLASARRYILDRVREDGGVRVADLVRELGVSDMTIRRDLELLARPRPAREGPRRRHGPRRERPVRAGLRRQVGAPAARRTRSPMRPSRLVEPGHGDRVSAGTTTYALARRLVDVPGLTVVTNSRARRRRAPPGRPRGPDDHPDRRRADTVGRARRAVRRGGAADRPRRPRVHGRPRHGRRSRVHVPEPARGRDRPRPRRGRPPARRRGRPHASGASSGSARSPGSTRPTSSSPTAASTPAAQRLLGETVRRAHRRRRGRRPPRPPPSRRSTRRPTVAAAGRASRAH